MTQLRISPSRQALRPDLPLSAVTRISEQAAAAGWTDTVDMHGGEPRFAFPPAVHAALREADFDLLTKYSPVRGYGLLLERIRHKLGQVNRLDVSTDELMVVPGGAAALFSAVAVTLHGDRRKVILTDPCWEQYPRVVTAAGGIPILCRTERTGSHHSPDLNHLSYLVDDETAAVLLNTPLNPTGSVLRASELKQVAAVCARRGVQLIVDEEYETWTYGSNAHVTARRAVPEAISLFSFSKSFALTGIQLGYVCAPPHVIDAFKRFGLYSYLLPASPSQILAAAALTEDLPDYLAGVRAEYEERARYLYQELNRIQGVLCAMPEGGVYLFPRIAGARGDSLAAELMHREHLLCVPGEVAGPAGRGHVRLFIGVEEPVAREAVARIRRFMATVRK